MITKEIVKQMYAEFISMSDIAKHFGISRQALQQRFHRWKLKSRGHNQEYKKLRKKCLECKKIFNANKQIQKFCSKQCCLKNRYPHKYLRNINQILGNK